MGSRATPQPQRAWIAGPQELIGGQVDRIPAYDERSGDHLWTIVTCYRVDPAQWTDPAHTPTLDHESLLTVAGPGCFYCEEEYTPRVAMRRCPGDPRRHRAQRGPDERE